MDTMRDSEFLAGAKKSNLEIDPVPAEELAKTVAGLFDLNPVIVGKLKEILK
ncbi:MAG: hypothetical protein HYV04_20415 [Deltaproteobacteria bacterium]|nr:hypothetical protein [Deltaproteobacteria bacterium]